jgi:hypothetical protein
MDNENTQSDVSVENTVDPHCVNCGMPMTKSEDFGTDAEGDRSEQYCCHCMQGGNLV